MSESQHLNFNRTIFVDGVEACQCVKDDAPLFEEAYSRLFKGAEIKTLTVLQMAKRKRAAKEVEEEGDAELPTISL